MSGVAPGEDPLLHAFVQAAADVCQAEHAWLLVPSGGAMLVAAAATTSAAAIGAAVVGDAGVASFVVGSRQPAALSGPSVPATGVAASLGITPSAVLAVPCEDSSDELRGVIELVDRRGGTTFGFDEIELATLVAGLCGAALERLAVAPVGPPPPGLLQADLGALATSQPGTYAALAALVRAVGGR